MDFEYMVNVRFKGNPTLYAYLTNISDLKVGDKVVVDTPANGYTIVTVEARAHNQGPYLTPTSKATKPIVCKVYDANYKAYLAKKESGKKMDEMASLLKRAESLRAELRASGIIV